ncbi:5-amino-6-(5-phospho-D-ribitylamino)uracil phosphatase, chloroplastic-like [Mangifera indica]|uniref:5-amino-6-(5-phospho-D-ribitylamino)uracil phosphatase, chloroplastic-like n=1 Tax=Mangifera indica TaxID=29780 RepID=UPI001CF94946|nr:5-amino-6-(5-phospho-D-ribitylamino)uracil phosphatase, chloroplastic-like [Mangifera indica]XP_044476968.1 5-amino-6-(5-phospho-D-ribitylamino)uracil phosphatase, chloroplastic-like [Mangifera indica]
MVVDSISALSFLGHWPMCPRIPLKDVSGKRKLSDNFRFSVTEFIGGRVVSFPILKADRSISLPISALAVELAKETYSFREEDRIRCDWNYRVDTGVDWKSGLWPPENKADNPSLHNPLLRHERMGCGWLGAIFEWEGVIIEDNPDIEKQAWLTLAQEEGKSPPPAFILRRVEGMKNEQATSEVLCWSRDPTELRRMALRWEEIYQALQGGINRLRNGSKEFVNVLMNYKIPMALVSTCPRKILETAIVTEGIEEYFTAIIAAEDVHRGKPDPEMFVYAAQLLKFIPERCIVFGNSNQTVEAAHDARMKCVAVASKHPVYELGAADLVVRQLDELSVVDLKNLGDIESPESESLEPELELEEEEDYPSSSTAVDDIFW